MSGWSEVFLGVIAAATLAIAAVQVGLVVAAWRLTRRVDRLTEQVAQELQPFFANVNAIGRDASRAVALAAAQVDRADRLFGDLVMKIDQTVTLIQSNIVAPAREGRAIFAALRATIAALRDARGRVRQGRGDDEDALFI